MHFTHNRRGRGVVAAAAMLAVLMVAVPSQARQKISQLSEDDAVTRTLPADSSRSVLSASTSTRVCEKNAKWIRLGFKSLVLKSYDSLVVTSSGGDRYVFQGGHWNDRSFHARALRGSCVDIQPYFANPESAYKVGSYDFGTRALALATVTVAGAGDICDSGSASTCQATSDLIVSINPTAVFTAGDNVYSNGTLSEFNARYAPTWGRFKTLTKPTPGNHDYNTSGAAGYFDYFNGSGVQTGLAGDRSKGYYSWDVGDWHFVALNTMSGGTVSAAQISWLQSDLAANTKPCTAAYFHHPLFSRGNYGGYSQVKPFWDALYAAKADLVLVGHDHNYQRYAKMNPSQVAAADGLRQVLVGTGGRSFYGVQAPSGLLEVSNANTHGVLKLTLTATGYTGDFVPRSGSSFTDRFTGTCNKAGSGGNVAPVANFTSTTSGLTATFTNTSTDSDGTIASRAWDFGDGTTSTVNSPSKTYTAAGTYNVRLTVTDNGGLSHSKTAAVTVVAGNVAPVANYTWTTSGLTVTFTNTSTDSDGTIASRAWDFGDSTTSTVNSPSKTYTAAGTYNVRLTVTDNGGLSHSKTAAVTVSAVNVAPVANFTSTTSGLTATFTDTSTDSNGTIASRSWAFGDGTSSTVANPSKTYAAAGTYNVTLTVTDNGGLTNSKTVAVTVVSGPNCGGTVLCSGVAVALPSVAKGGVSSTYTLVVPAGKTSAVFTISGGTGDADLYVRLGSAPTSSTYNCRPYKTGNSETCTMTVPAAGGTYYVNVRAYTAYSGVSLKGTISP